VGTNYQGFKERVMVKSFDAIIAEFGLPDFVKVDVEGFEENVISGLTVPLKNCTFLVETRENTKDYIFKYFHQRGYTCSCIERGDQIIQKAEEIPAFANLFFDIKE
jgi:pimeloyl-CoA synthetase